MCALKCVYIFWGTPLYFGSCRSFSVKTVIAKKREREMEEVVPDYCVWERETKQLG
jgi:hypothetical protein